MNYKLHYKECVPEKTVERLKNKLKKMDINTDEIMYNESRIGTKSIRVVFKGTSLGTNGKGINKEYCMASAYAELFERYQNDYINPYPDFRKRQEYSFRKMPCENYLTAEELINQNDPFLNFYFQVRNMAGVSFEKKIEMFRAVNSPDVDGEKYLSIPYYDIRSEKVFYLPYALSSGYYGSNGMAAGNEPAEALVQGLAEIIERVVQKKIMLEAQNLPDVPDDYIEQFPYIYEMYKKAQEIEGYNIYMKDCSLGGKYPVAGLMIIEKNTGNYGLKLGCHPDFCIAMERVLTEATQGTDIERYTERSRIDFSNLSVQSSHNVMNSFATGLAQYPYQVIARDYGEKFIPVKTVTGKNNEEILSDWIDELIKDGYDIMIADRSWLGFPTYHIIVPGLSETNIMTDKDIKVYNTLAYVTEVLKSPDDITEEICKYIQGVIGHFKGNILLDGTSQMLPYSAQKTIYGTGAIATRYLAAVCDVYCNKYDEALKKLMPALNSTGLFQLPESEVSKFKSECMYLDAMCTIGDHKTVMLYLKELVSEDIYNYLDELYCEPKKIFIKLLPTITDKEIEDTCQELSTIYSVMDKLKDAMMENPISQEKFGEYLKNIL